MDHQQITISHRELSPVCCRKCGSTLEAHYTALLTVPFELQCTGCLDVIEMPGAAERAMKRQFAIARKAQKLRKGKG